MSNAQMIGMWALIEFIKETMPTISQGHDANLKFENEKWKLWVVRTGDSTRSLRLEKRMEDGTWKTLCELDAPIEMIDDWGDCHVCHAFVQRDGHVKGCPMYDYK